MMMMMMIMVLHTHKFSSICRIISPQNEEYEAVFECTSNCKQLYQNTNNNKQRGKTHHHHHHCAIISPITTKNCVLVCTRQVSLHTFDSFHHNNNNKHEYLFEFSSQI